MVVVSIRSQTDVEAAALLELVGGGTGALGGLGSLAGGRTAGWGAVGTVSSPTGARVDFRFSRGMGSRATDCASCSTIRLLSSSSRVNSSMSPLGAEDEI